MRFQFTCNKFLLSAALLLGSAFSVHAETAAETAAQANSSEFEFSVTAATKDQTHPHYNVGNKVGFVINGAQGRPLVLVRGKTYKFNVNTPPMHDFYLTSDPVGAGPGALSEGVEGNFTFRGTVTFKPSKDTPDLVYYACRNHQNMGGEIHIVNPGEEEKFKSTMAAAPKAAAKTAPTFDKNEVRQKLSFAGMSINGSEASKRIETGSNEEAKAKYKSAQEKLAAANSAFDADKIPEAKGLIDEAMNLMSEARNLAPSQFVQQRQKAKVEELIQGLHTMEASFKENREALSKSGAKNLPTLNSETIQKIIASAKALSAEGNYDAAVKVLSGSTKEVSATLSSLLANQTMGYEMKFTSPEQEYAYELERFNHLDKLLPQALAEKNPPQTVIPMVDKYKSNAKDNQIQAAESAQRKDFVSAIENIKNATEQLESALKLISAY